MHTLIPLCALVPGQQATVRRLDMPEPLRRRLLDLGLIPHTTVACVGRSPGGDPTAYEICHAVVAIRRVDAAGVWVQPLVPGEGDTYGAD